MGRSSHHDTLIHQTCLRFCLTAIVALSAASSSCVADSAHPVSVTSAVIHVDRSRISVSIDVFLEDLFLFHNLQPNEADFLSADTIRGGIRQHQEFIARRFVIQSASGSILTPSMPPKVEFVIPPDGVALGQLMEHTLTFEMQYAVDEAPEFLTFQQQFTDDDGILLSEMQLRIDQQGVGEIFSRSVPANAPETVRFDWLTPLLPKNASEKERENHALRQQEAALGITSYSSVYGFLYIEPYEVRLEVLIPLMTLDQALPLQRADTNFLSTDEQQTLRPLIEDYFVAGNPVLIDDEAIVPQVDRCDFFGVDLRDFARQSDPRTVAMASARVGVILSFPLQSPPRSLKLTWDRFPRSLWAVNLVVFAPDAAFRRTLSRIGGNNVLTWEAQTSVQVTTIRPVVSSTGIIRPLRLPILSICLATACGLLPLLTAATRQTHATRAVQALLFAGAVVTWPGPFGWIDVTFPWQQQTILRNEADDVFRHLHANIYQAFQFRSESDIYDALDASTSGELLPDLYQQIRNGLQMQEQGGAVARIERVEILDLMPAEPAPAKPQETAVTGAGSLRFGVRCRWNVSGTVEHWGHIHERTNQFEAIFTAASLPQRGAASDPRFIWKLIDMQLADSRSIHSETRLRGLQSP